MPARHLPVRPDLEQLKHQAKDLLRAIRAGEPEALADLATFHPGRPTPADVKLADAQLALARSYQAPSWPRLVQACQLIDAIWTDDIETVRTLVTRNPALIHEPARIEKDNWGPPMSYAANVGRDRIIQLLHSLGATDLEHALDRAALQSKVATARMLHEMMGRPTPTAEYLGGTAYTLSASGTEFLLQAGAPVVGADGKRLAPTEVVLQSDSRKPEQKHRILELYERHGLKLPDTPSMAVHRGRIDLLERHLVRDPSLLERTWSFDDIFPPELGCDPARPSFTHGSPLTGVTLLHLAVEYDEFAIVRWLLDRGMDVNQPAAVRPDGFGGHTALFGVVVSYPNFWMNYQHRPQVAPMTELLLAHGADPGIRVALRHKVEWGDQGMREYRDVTPVSWGQRFVEQFFVSRPAMELIAAAGGVP